jgi:hypothetical protein
MFKIKKKMDTYIVDEMQVTTGCSSTILIDAEGAG